MELPDASPDFGTFISFDTEPPSSSNPSLEHAILESLDHTSSYDGSTQPLSLPNYSFSMSMGDQQMSQNAFARTYSQIPSDGDPPLPAYDSDLSRMIAQHHNTDQLAFSPQHAYSTNSLFSPMAIPNHHDQPSPVMEPAFPNLFESTTAPQDLPVASPKKSKRKSRKRTSVDLQVNPLAPAPEQDDEFPILTSPTGPKSDSIRERNRIAAKKCREKAKSQATELESLARGLFQQKRFLTDEMTQLQAEAYRMKKICLDHICCDGNHLHTDIDPGLPPATPAQAALNSLTGPSADSAYDSPSSTTGLARTLSWARELSSPPSSPGFPRDRHSMQSSEEHAAARVNLKAVLDRIGLSSYHNTLVRAGYPTWDAVLSVTEPQLSALGFKLGHRRVLQREIASFRNQSVESPLELPAQLESPSSPAGYGGSGGVEDDWIVSPIDME